MNYSDLVKQTASIAGVSQSIAKDTLDAAVKVIKDAIKSGDAEVAVKGVGKFGRKVRPARTGINPATGEKVEVPETVSVTFRVSGEFRKYLND